ncbi:unnamed protein product, partial [Urochloa humidicola]
RAIEAAPPPIHGPRTSMGGGSLGAGGKAGGGRIPGPALRSAFLLSTGVGVVVGDSMGSESWVGGCSMATAA